MIVIKPQLPPTLGRAMGEQKKTIEIKLNKQYKLLKHHLNI